MTSSDGIATNETASVAGTDFGIVRTLDPYGRQIGLSVDGMPDTTLAYAVNGLIASISNEECHVDYLYDAIGGDMGHTLTLTNGVSFSRSLTRHAYLRDEILSVVNVCGGDTNRYDYTYDVLHRPITRNADTFAYNRRGEVASATVAGQSAAYAYDFIGNEQPANCLNQYLGLTYSPNGELVSDGTFTYAYDALSRLSVAYSNSTLVVSNRYDHLGRRVVKIAADGTHTFLYNGWRPVVETIARSGGGTDRIDYVWGKDISGTLDGAAGIGGLLYLKLNGAIFVPFYDAYGNVMGYRDAEGNVVASYTYDAFGRIVAQNGTMADMFAIRYSTKYYDKETGLYYYGKRHYSPVWRRWLTRDPIGEEGGANLYGFCGNNAVARWDADGRAYFAVRPLHNCPFMIQGSMGSYLDVKNIEFLHEQLFFEDGGIFPTIGWGDDQEGSGKGMYMLYEDPSQYQKRDGGYDDCVMREAVRQVQPSHYQMTIIGRATKCNCQDYAAALRAKYKVLENDHDVWCKCCKEKR